jgi:hypothetical protein
MTKSHSSTTIVLNNLVLCMQSTTVVDARGAGLLLDGDRILTHILEVDMVERARAEAVHTLGLVRADDDVRERRTLLQEEDRVGVASLILTVARAGAAVEADVGGRGGVGRAGGDGDRRAQRGRLGRRRERARSCAFLKPRGDEGLVSDRLVMAMETIVLLTG